MSSRQFIVAAPITQYCLLQTIQIKNYLNKRKKLRFVSETMITESDDIETRANQAFERIVDSGHVAIARTALSRFENMYPPDSSDCSMAKKIYLKKDLLSAFVDLEKQGYDTYMHALEMVEIIRKYDDKIRKNKILF